MEISVVSWPNIRPHNSKGAEQVEHERPNKYTAYWGQFFLGLNFETVLLPLLSPNEASKNGTFYIF